MNKIRKNLLMVMVLVFTLVMQVTFAYASENTQKNTIEVSGKATIKVKPNIAYVSVSVRTEDKDAKKAQEDNARIVEAVKKELVSQYGLTDTDIRTSYYNINPTYDYIEGKQTFRAYVVEHALEVTVKDIDKVGNIIDTAVANGATSIQNVRFDIIDSDTTYNVALQKAVANATAKGQSLAQAIGKTNIRPISIIEQSGSIGIVERGMAKMEMMADSVAPVATSIQQNEIEVTARVLVTFQY